MFYLIGIALWQVHMSAFTIPFDTLESCEATRREIIKQYPKNTQSVFICVPKNK